MPDNRVDGNVGADADGVAIGQDIHTQDVRLNIDAGRYEWRRGVVAWLYEHSNQIAAIKGIILAAVLAGLVLLAFVALWRVGESYRMEARIDQQSLQIRSLERQVDTLQLRLPFSGSSSAGIPPTPVGDPP